MATTIRSPRRRLALWLLLAGLAIAIIVLLTLFAGRGSPGGGSVADRGRAVVEPMLVTVQQDVDWRHLASGHGVRHGSTLGVPRPLPILDAVRSAAASSVFVGARGTNRQPASPGRRWFVQAPTGGAAGARCEAQMTQYSLEERALQLFPQ